MNWQEIIEREPRLNELLKKAEEIKDDGSGEYFCANEIWYRDFKPQLNKLVGYFTENTVLNTSECYDIAYQKIYNVLPGCRNCGCF
jgi:hypothetical protein